MRNTAYFWKYKVRINAIIANFVFCENVECRIHNNGSPFCKLHCDLSGGAQHGPKMALILKSKGYIFPMHK